MSFATGFSAGLQLIENQKKYENDAAIEKAGKEVAEERAKEKAAKDEQDRLLNLARPKTDNTQPQVEPRVYQKGDSLGLEGYQDTNKPVQTTVQAAPAGYQSRSESDFTNDLSPGGLDYPAANPATEQTLVGNYGTTAAFKGEKPTEADIKSMQTDTTGVPFQAGPFTGKNEQVTSLTDLAANKPVAAPQEEVKPKPLDTLNDHITAADMAKESYENQLRVLRKLEDGGNYKAAIEFKSKLANTELTLAQADHMKFTTTAAIMKQVGNFAENALEDIKQPGADVNKIYFDMVERARKDLGYTGKIPFSLDPNENIKTLERLSKDSTSTLEKLDVKIKEANTQIEKSYKQAKLEMDKYDLMFKGFAENRAQRKENREEIESYFKMVEANAKVRQSAINSLNSVQDEATKKVLKTELDNDLAKMKSYADGFGIKFNPGTTVNTTGGQNPAVNTKVGTPTVGTPATNVTTGNPTVNPVNNAFHPEDIKEVTLKDTAGGFDPNAKPVAKTPTQQKAEDVATKKTSNEVKANEARIKMLTDRLDRKALAKSAAQSQLKSEADISKKVDEMYTKDWEKTKAFWGKVLGPDDEDAIKEIEKLQNRNKELQSK